MAQKSNRFAVYIAGGRLVSMVAGFIMPLLLVRLMPQADYGVFSQFFTFYSALYVILAFGIHTNVFFFCPSANKEESDKYVSNTIVLLCAFGVVACLFLFIPFLKTLVFGNSELGKYSDLVILCIALAVPMNIISPLNTITKDKWGAMLMPGFIAFARIGVILVSVLFFHEMHNLFQWLLAFQIAVLAIVIAYTLSKVKFHPDFSLFKSQLVYSLPFGFAVALQLFSNFFDKFVCIHFLDPKEYAIYGVAFLSIPGITQIYDSLCQVNIVNMSQSYHEGKKHEIVSLYSNFVVKTLSFSTPIILIVALYAEEIMQFLYTSNYVAAAPFFRLYSLTFLVSMFGAGTILRSVGKTRLSLCAFIITCAIGLPLTYFLVGHYGTSGAILGAMVNIILPRIIQITFEIHVTKSNLCTFFQWRKMAKIVIPSILLLIPVTIIKVLYHFNIWICMVEAVFYIGMLYYYFIKEDVFILQREKIIRSLGHIIK